MNIPAESRLRHTGSWTVAVLLAVMAYCLLWVWQGFDVSDEGHHLVNQELFLLGRTEYPFGMLWFTHMVGGLWLRLTAPLGLLGARLGWAVTMALTAAVAHRILRMYYPARLAAVATCAAAVLSMHHGIMVISQNNLAFLLLLSGAGLILGADRRAASEGARAGRALAGAGGAMLALAAMARFPLVPGLGLVVLPAAVRWMQARSLPRSCLANGLAAVAGWLATVALCLAGLGAAGHLSAYLRAVSGQGINDEYTVSTLLELYVRDGRTMFVYVATLVVQAAPWAVGLAVICRLAGLRRFAPLAVAAAGVLWLAQAVRAEGVDAVHWEFFLLMPGVLIAGVLVEMAVLFVRGGRDDRAVDRQMLLAFALGTAALIVPGTNNGLLNLIHGLWILAPAMLLGAPECAALLAPDPDSAPGWRRGTSRYTVAVAAVFVLFSAANRFVNPFRDDRARWRLTEDIGVDRIGNIFTTPGRAESVRSLCRELRKRTVEGETLLAYPALQMVHYATRTVPALDNPAPAFIGSRDLLARFKALETSGSLPRLAVRGHADFGSHKWGSHPTRMPADPEVKAGKIRFLDSELVRLGYQPVWSNREFTVLERIRDGALKASGAE